MSVNRRGFSLIELMVALVVAGLFAALAADTTARLQLVGRARSERSGMAALLRQAAGMLRRELILLGADSVAGVDHQLVASNSITFRSERGVWVVCRVSVDSIVLANGPLPSLRSRNLSPGRDSLLLYLPGDTTNTIDAWLPLPVRAGPFVRTCPGGGSGTLVATTLDSTTIARHRIGSLTVARAFETSNARLYLSGTTPTLGLEELSAGGTIQPVAGPLIPGVGLSLVSLLKGPVVSDYDLTLRAMSSGELAVGPGQVPSATDSIRIMVPLRNVP